MAFRQEVVDLPDIQPSRGRPFGLYVHVPFCANICYYCACNKVITKDRGRAQPYLQRLEQEIRFDTDLWIIEVEDRHLDVEEKRALLPSQARSRQ